MYIKSLMGANSMHIFTTRDSNYIKLKSINDHEPFSDYFIETVDNSITYCSHAQGNNFQQID